MGKQFREHRLKPATASFSTDDSSTSSASQLTAKAQAHSGDGSHGMSYDITIPIATSLPQLWDNKYVLTSRLESGMSEVYLAHTVDPSCKPVVVKLLKDTSEVAMMRFLREVDMMNELLASRVPHVSRLLDHSVCSGLPYLVMEYVPAPSLRAVMRDNIFRVDLLTACRIIRDAGMVLGHLHQLEIVHRDIKPSNILVAPDGATTVIDFGVAKRDTSEDDLTSLGSVPGTHKYMSPEQRSGESVDCRSDIYSLGLVFEELLDQIKQRSSEEVGGTGWRQAIAVARRMTCIDRALRYATTSQICADLEQLSRTHFTARQGNRFIAVAMSLTAVIALFIGIFIGNRQANSDPHASPQSSVSLTQTESSNAISTSRTTISSSDDDSSPQKSSADAWVRAHHGKLIRASNGRPETLMVNRAEVSDSDLRRFSPLISLKTVDLKNTSIVGDGLAAFPRKLELLNLAGTMVNDRSLSVLAERSVETLDLSRTEVSELGLANIGFMPELSTLVLNHCRGVSDAAMERIAANFPNLTTLELLNTKVTDVGIEKLASLPLQTVELSFTECTGRGLGAFPAESLQEVWLNNTRADDESVASFTSITSLRILHLNLNPQLTDKCLNAMATLPQLETLSLRFTSISPSGLKLLANHPRLKQLDILCTSIDDLAVAHKILPGVSLRASAGRLPDSMESLFLIRTPPAALSEMRGDMNRNK